MISVIASRVASKAISRRRVENALRWNIVTSLTVAAFAAVLYYTYKLKVSPLFAYSGLTFRQPDLVNYSVVIILVIVVGMAMPRRIIRTSDFILWILFVVCVSPSMLLAQYSATLSRTEALRMSLAMAGTMLMMIILTHIAPRLRIHASRLNKGVDFWVVLAITSTLIYTYLIFAVGIKLNFLALSEVYTTRADFKFTSSGDYLIGYVLPVQVNIINPLFFARGIYSRRILPVLVACLGQIVIYSTTGLKSTLFSIFAMTGVAFLFRIYRRPPGIALAFAMTAVSTGALLVDRLTGGITWTSLISRRVMIVPGALTAAYVAVFFNRPRMNFSDVLPFVRDPYHGVSTVKIVGADFVGNAGTAANVNFFGHGYLNSGYAGMFIEGLVLVALLMLANAATRGLPTAVSSIVFLAPSIALGSSSVFTAALTHGFLAGVVLCAVAPGNGWSKRQVNRGPRLRSVTRHRTAAQQFRRRSQSL